MTQYDRRTAIINPVGGKTSNFTQMSVGGKIRSPIRGLNKAITGLNKINPVMMAVKDPTLNKGMRQLGKFTNKELLPAVVSTGIPLASTALGALATMYGGPMAGEMASSLSENLMKEYIPDRYQSKNKYIGLLSDAIQAGVSQDPNELLGVQTQFLDTVENDLARKRPRYDPENPYRDLMAQLQNKYPQYYVPQPQQMPPQSQPIKQSEQIVENDNAIYGNSELGEGADSLVIKTPPYQQKEGSMSGMLGGKLKKSKKKPKVKEVEEEIEVYIKKKLPHKKFSHPKNSSLEQLLEAEAEKKEKKSKKAFDEMVEKQTRALTALGFGIRKKGSKEAKEWGQKMKALREAKKKK